MKFTRFDSSRPLGKEWHLLPDDTLEKHVNGQMTEGTFTTLERDTAAEFADVLNSLSANQALSSSLCIDADSGRVVTEKALSANPGAYARTKASFVLKPGQPTFALIDFDCAADGKVWTPESARDWLITLWPDLASAGMVIYASGSSCIFEGDKQHRGLTSLHVYLFIQDASDLKRFGDALFKLAFLAGHGHIHVSASGALSPRTVFDAAVFHPARLVFTGPSTCLPPLQQRRPDPAVFDGPAFDTSKVLLTSEQEATYTGMLESAKAKARPAAEAARAAWIDAHLKTGLTTAVNAGEDLAEARVNLRRDLEAAIAGTLLGKFLIVLVDEHGNEITVTVDHLLANLEKYHLWRCLSVLDNNHRGRSPDAVLYLMQARPCIFDLNDGGIIYHLYAQPIEIEVSSGNRAQAAKAIADVMAQQDDLFLLAGQAVQMSEEKVIPLTPPLLAFRIGHHVSLYRQGKDKKTRLDPDMQLVAMVAALLPQMLRSIVARSSIPLIDTAGRVISAPGLDEETGIYISRSPGESISINLSPTRQETVAALRRLWHPFSCYRWATKHDRAAFLATILTIVIRPTILASFGLFVSATCQASGKSKALEALLALITGLREALISWKPDDEIELGKLLLSLMLKGTPGIAFDNVVKVFRSPTLCTAIMSGMVKARLLGVSEDRTASARLMWLASGNGVSMDRDSADRWCTATVDVGCERPGDLSYPFDPVQAALDNRLGIIQACITVHRAYHEAGRPQADNVPTRIAEWGRSVRQLVLWLGDSGIAAEAGIGDLGDPTHCMSSAATSVDFETEAYGTVLQGLLENFDEEPYKCSTVRAAFDRGAAGMGEGDQLIHEGLSGLMPNARPGQLSSQSINAVFKARAGRIVGGLKVETVTQYGAAANRGSYWRVRRVAT